MNISWYSPLDPASSEIARYSAQLLPLLQEFAAVAAVDDGSGDASAPWWQAAGATSVPEQGVAPLPVYHIGNNPLHLPIYQRETIKVDF